MLQIKDVKKKYVTGGLTQQALAGVSLNLRDNEFVSILGPSGSGKTTLLNIIGGLDIYDEGDIIINNVSTKHYRDRDWDSYRAHTIGFVFQSYNLIPHQTILSNVELALTISGYKGKDKRQKALAALDRVGLKEHAHKKPNQLSGGQMQRVAIARALVNDPKIVLADEPTGALDTHTSIQVMELLKEVAKDRLVVMVTHNPELAEEYSTRIVRLKDGRIVSDSDPLVIEDSATEAKTRNLGKAGMSLFTSMHLSFNNLWTKKARTFLVAFAGSIGIIGISLIMSLSNGANDYIQTTEEKTLSEYPLTISRSTMDLTSLLTVAQDIQETEDDGKIHEQQVVSGMFGTIRENDLKSFKEYLDSGESGVEQYVNAIEYSYDVTPRIYKINEEGTARQVLPDTVVTGTSLSTFTSFLGSSYSSTFNPLPTDASLYQDQYEVVAGHWPENDHELVIVLNTNNGLSDLALYNLGLKDADELDRMIASYQEGSTENQLEVGNAGSWDYDEVLGIEFKLVNPSALYEWDEDAGVWADKSDDADFVNSVAAEGTTLTVAGIVRPTEEDTSSVLTTGINYSPNLTREVVEAAEKSEIVKAQLADTEVNVLTGKRFDAEEEDTDFDLASMIDFDEDALGDLFTFDESSISLDTSALEGLDINIGNTDLSSMIDTSALTGMFGSLSESAVLRAFDGVTVDITEEKMTKLFDDLYAGFEVVSQESTRTDITKLQDSVTTYFQTEDASAIIVSSLTDIINASRETAASSPELTDIANRLLTGFNAYVTDNELDPENVQENASAYLQTEEAQGMLSEFASVTSTIILNDTTSTDAVASMLQQLADGYSSYADANDLPVPSEIADAYIAYMQTDEAKQILEDAANDMIDMETLKNNLNGIAAEVGGQVAAAIGASLSSAMTQISTQIAAQLESAITSMMTSYMDNISSSFVFDPSSLENMIDFNMSAESLKTMMASMLADTGTDADSILSDLGYADLDDPQSITFYPIDFDSKTAVVNMLNDYNDRMTEAGEDDKVISFTDTVGTLMSSVTTIINIIGYVLIAFVAISLVVSSIMIGVITYISVLERRKEIGILRAMGASKHNITQVFNSETIITGFLAGLIGVAVTWLLLIPGNIILQTVTGQPDLHAFLPAQTGALLVLLSVVLTMIGGFIPSKGAAKQDPVIALRSE